jgi:hypothetical protein
MICENAPLNAKDARFSQNGRAFAALLALVGELLRRRGWL